MLKLQGNITSEAMSMTNIASPCLDRVVLCIALGRSDIFLQVQIFTPMSGLTNGTLYPFHWSLLVRRPELLRQGRRCPKRSPVQTWGG